MTSPDSPSPRTEADMTNLELMQIVSDALGRARGEDPLRELFRRAEAAQEAPAPDGLRAALARYDLFVGAARRRNAQWLDGFGEEPNPRDRHEHPDTYCMADRDRAELLALIDTALAAPPSPAEPPRPFRDHETCVPHDHVEPDIERWERDQAAARSRSEARPPEGLDTAMQAVLDAIEVIPAFVHDGRLALSRDRVFDELHALAVRLSAGGAALR